MNVLLSYAYHGRGSDTDLRAARAHLVCGRLMVDSGAFTAHTTGRPVVLREYAEWLTHWRGAWDHAITLDAIGDPAVTARQTRQLHAWGLPVTPVFTIGASLAEFDAMVRDCRLVACGGTAGTRMSTADRTARIRMLQRRASLNGGGIHALGVASMDVLRAARPESADAAGASGMWTYGKILYWDGAQLRMVSVSDRARLAADRDHITALGIDAAELIRTGRLPGAGDQGVRQVLARAYALAYACADESLPGTRLYNSVTPVWGVEPAAGLDRALHSGYRPGAWVRWGARHPCGTPAEV